jgi:methionyl-tRNA formyltransferase
MKQKIVFFGGGEYTIPVVEKLLNHGLDLVITTEKNPDSKLLRYCKEQNIQTLTAQTSSDLTNNQSLITNHNVAVLASYGAFVPEKIINMFQNGIINIHPSLLPKYKGPSPIQYALLNGETVTGVTLIKLDNEIDHGSILAQRPYELSGNETSEDLLSILFEIGGDMVEELIIKLEKIEVLNETPQDHTKETWSYKIEKKDGMIDLNDIPTDPLEIKNFKLKIARKVRAFYPWPGVWFVSRIKNQESRIKLLPENKIQVEGKNPMNYKDFINGFGEEGKEILDRLSLY